MATSVTAVAPVQILLAVTCKVSHLIAFVALLATAAATTAELSVAGSSRTTTSSTNILAIAGIVARPVTLEARISGHFVRGSFFFAAVEIEPFLPQSRSALLYTTHSLFTTAKTVRGRTLKRALLFSLTM